MVTISDLGLILEVSCVITKYYWRETAELEIIYFSCSGDPLYVGFDLTIASFDSISEVSMVSILAQYANTSAYISFPQKYYT